MALKDTALCCAPPQRCKFARLFESLDDADRDVLVGCRRARHYGAPALTAGLLEDGHDIGISSVTAHFSGSCMCRGATDPLFNWAPPK